MKKLLVIPALVVSLIVVGGCAGNDASSEDLIRIEMRDPINLDVFATEMGRADVGLLEFVVVSGDMQAGCTVLLGETIEDAEMRFRAQHQKFLNESILSTEASLAARGPQTTMHERLKASLLSARNDLHAGVLEVQRVTLPSADLRHFDGLGIEYRKIANVNPGGPKESDDDIRVDEEENGSVPYSYHHESWAPYGGTSKVTQGISYQTFYFNNVSDYDSDDTYEHEARVYDVNFADYGGYWNSNLPYAYYDTPFGDSIDNFTVGSSSAYQLQTYTMYYTTMSLTAGSSSSATVRIKGQKGHRFPYGCHSTWCIFADATTGSMTTYTAPIQGISWEY